MIAALPELADLSKFTVCHNFGSRSIHGNTLLQFLLIYRKARAGELERDSGLSQLARLTEVDVDEVGVTGAKHFFEAKVYVLKIILIDNLVSAFNMWEIFLIIILQFWGILLENNYNYNWMFLILYITYKEFIISIIHNITSQYSPVLQKQTL